jgi:hypothetical protein
VLRGYKWSTLISYNATVRKFVKSMESQGRKSFTLPVITEDIYHFCFWAGREKDQPTDQDVTAKTVREYLYGIKAWSLYHDKEYPHTAEGRVTVMLQASAKEDAAIPPKERKKAVMIKHLVLLARNLLAGGKKERAVLDLALVAFWGLA